MDMKDFVSLEEIQHEEERGRLRDIFDLDIIQLKAPRKYLCPYCGQWHNWCCVEEWSYGKDQFLFYNAYCVKFFAECPNTPIGCTKGIFAGQFVEPLDDDDSEGRLGFWMSPIKCSEAGFSFSFDFDLRNEKISQNARRIMLGVKKPILLFDVPCTFNPVFRRDCYAKSYCPLMKMAHTIRERDNHVTFGFFYEERDWDLFGGVDTVRNYIKLKNQNFLEPLPKRNVLQEQQHLARARARKRKKIPKLLLKKK